MYTAGKHLMHKRLVSDIQSTYIMRLFFYDNADARMETYCMH